MNDFKNLFILIQTILDTPMTIWGFTFTWGNILIFSLVGSLLVGALYYLFDSEL